MFEGILNLSDPSKNSYYYPILLGIATILLLIQLIILILKDYQKKKNPGVNLNQSLDITFNKSKVYPPEVNIDEVKDERETLRTRYLIAFVLTRSAMWSKAPYLYTLFMTVHKFSFAEIGILYLVDAVAALILGPITGQLADKYGRKLFCHCYNISIIINLALRMIGSRFWAYVAQVVTGFGAGLICTTFEAWVVSESEKVFGNLTEEAERFRKRLFVKSNIYDASVSIITSIICAFIYSYLGIYAPFWISIILSFLALVYIGFAWKENELQVSKKESVWKQLDGAFDELKKVDVLCVGLIEGIAMACLNIYLFSWTPILKQSTPGGMNVGFIFTSMVLTMIVGTKSYEVLIVYLKLDYYMSIAGCMLFQGLLLFLTYYVEGFLCRMIFLALFNGLTGFYNPLNSIVKSNILVEKYRALLMNLFRVPLNTYVIIVLLTLRYMNSFTVALIAGTMCYIAFGIGLFLVIYLRIHKNKGDDKEPLSKAIEIK
jgi:MFS family permease